MTIDTLIHIMPFAGFIGLFWYTQLLEKRIDKLMQLTLDRLDLAETTAQRCTNNLDLILNTIVKNAESRCESLISHIDQRTQQGT